jgi:DNA helicase HerA-like ATPase
MVWLLPSLVAGVALALITHSWAYLALSVATSAASFLAQLLRGRAKFEGEVHICGAGVAIGNRVLPRSSFFWSREVKSRVFEALQSHSSAQRAQAAIQKLIDEDFRLTPVDGIQALVGFDGNGEVRFDLAADGPHLFVIGPTGSGKSRWLEMYLSSMISTHAEIDYWLADFKGGATLGHFAPHQNCIAFTTDLEDSREFWAVLTEFVHLREIEFAKLGISRIEQSQNQRRQVVVVDELIPALRSGSLSASAIEAIATRGRSLGIHLIAASQATSGMGRILLTNLRAKLILAGTDAVDMAQLGVTEKLANEATPGQARGLLVTPGRVTRFSFPLLFRPARLPAVPRRARVRRQPER